MLNEPNIGVIELTKRLNLIAIQTTLLFWQQKQMPMLLMKEPHTLKNKKQKEKKAGTGNTLITWKCNISPHTQENCLLEGGIFYQFEESASALDIYDQVINLDVLIELLAQQSNLYSQQDRRNFLTNVEELKTFTGVNYIMPVNPLPSMPMS